MNWTRIGNGEILKLLLKDAICDWESTNTAEAAESDPCQKI
jgi:hypothetical protein